METTTLLTLPYNKQYIGQNYMNSSQSVFVRWQIFHTYFVYFLCSEIVIIIPTVFGNALILTSIAKFRRLRTDMHILVANLAVSDLLVGLVLIPADMIFLCMQDQLYGVDTKYLCLATFGLNITLLFSSVFNLCLISMERYIVIVHPLSYSQRCSWYRLSRVIAGSWIIAFTIGFLPMMGWNNWQSSLPCDAEFVLPLSFRSMLESLLVIVLLLNTVMYIIVVRTAWKQMDRVAMELRDNSDHFGPKQRTLKRDFRKTKVMILILGVFIICWGPYCICALVTTFIGDYQITVIVSKFLFQLGILNSGLNWIIFGLKNKEYRHAFKQILKCNKEGNDNSFTMTSSTDKPRGGGPNRCVNNTVHPKISNKDKTLNVESKRCVTPTFQPRAYNTTKTRNIGLNGSPKTTTQPRTSNTTKTRSVGLNRSPKTTTQPRTSNTTKTRSIGLNKSPHTTAQSRTFSTNRSFNTKGQIAVQSRK